MSKRICLVVLCLFFLSVPSKRSSALPSTASEVPLFNIQTTYPVRLPGGRLPEANIEDAVDCNSPVHWDEAGNMYVFTSVRHPFRSTGKTLYGLSNPSIKTTIIDLPGVEGGKWLEATHRDPDGTLYGWYHNEPPPMCQNDQHLSSPRIGMMFSLDEGMTWQDLGIILEAPADSLNCFTKNYYFAGGNGDFSVILDLDRKYFYFFFGTYHAQLEEQGISIARMAYADRNAPIGKVWKYRNGAWNEPGLGGRVTPVFQVARDWHSETPDAYWGPSIHFNTHLNEYIIVMNRAINPYWQQEGVYLTANDDLSNPKGWSAPDRLPIDPQMRAYPQIVGVEKGETDKLVGKWGRLYLLGESKYLIEFRQSNNEEEEEGLPPAPPRPVRGTSEPLPDRPSVRAARPSFLTDLDSGRKTSEREKLKR